MTQVCGEVMSLDKQRVNICHFLSSHLLISGMHPPPPPTYSCALVHLEEGVGWEGVWWRRRRRRGIRL